MRQPRSRSLLLAGLVACATGIVSCTHPGDVADVRGVYEADYKVARETLTLQNNGTFTQVVTLKTTARQDSVQGRWRYDPVSGYVTLSEEFMLVLNGWRELNADYALPRKGLVSEPVESFFGRMTIGSSEGIVYRKRRS